MVKRTLSNWGRLCILGRNKPSIQGETLAEKPSFKTQRLEHWESHRALHRAINRIPDHFMPVLLELGKEPLSTDELDEFHQRLRILYGRERRVRRGDAELRKFLDCMIEEGILSLEGGVYALTPAGRELEEHVSQAVPYFVEKVLSPRGVARLTIIIHAILSVIKMFFGIASGSAGLISDGIDNTGDTLASVLVALGIRWDKQRTTSIFIIVLMFLSVIGVGWAAWGKIAEPAPIEMPWLSLAISLAAGLLMLIVSAYQYFVGMRHGNFALVCQAVDSRNHFLTSLLVALGIGLSMLSRAWDAPWLVYADAAASLIIGFMITKSAIELIGELRAAEEDQGGGVTHFLARGMGRWLENLTDRYVRFALEDEARSATELRRGLRGLIEEWKPRFHAMIDFGKGFIEKAPEMVEGRLDEMERSGELRRSGENYELSE